MTQQPPPSNQSANNNHALLVEQVRLVLAAISPLAFARLFLHWQPHPAQVRVLQHLPDFRQAALNCSRQWGKSIVGAIWALHRLFFVAGSTVLIVGPTGRQSGETLQKVREIIRILGIKTRGDGVNRNSIVLPNGSRIVGLPGKGANIRSFSSVSMVIFDEAARVKDDVYDALLPTLARMNGDVMLLSTPDGKRGEFYRAMTESERWFQHTGPVTECERISLEFLERERSRGETYFREEYLCEFIENGKFMMNESLVRRARKPDQEPWPWV